MCVSWRDCIRLWFPIISASLVHGSDLVTGSVSGRAVPLAAMVHSFYSGGAERSHKSRKAATTATAKQQRQANWHDQSKNQKCESIDEYLSAFALFCSCSFFCTYSLCHRIILKRQTVCCSLVDALSFFYIFFDSILVM